jgi:Family of unknown function (DUF6962)
VNAPFGFALHDPDVVLTDLGLALLGAYLGWRLARSPGRGTMTTSGVVIMSALASAALWGATFHAFFPGGTKTRPGFIAWIPVVLSILVVAAALLDLCLRISAKRLPSPLRRAIVAAYAAAFAAVTLLVDESYRTIVLFYAPVLVLFVIVAGWQAARTRSAGWILIAVSFAISALAAALQQARVSIDPKYFDHNAVYHVLQGIALVLLYRGFRGLTPQGTVGSAPAGAAAGDFRCRAR